MYRQQYYVTFNTAAGWVGILGSDEGLKCTTLPQSSEIQTLNLLGVNAVKAIPSPEYFQDLIKRYHDYFTSQRTDFPDKLDLGNVTIFQRQVWESTQQIPYGETRSYGWIARQIGKPGAARAVGQALRKNPLPIIIPCHRVLKNDGKLGGFSGGLELKKRLLALEKIHLAEQEVKLLL